MYTHPATAANVRHAARSAACVVVEPESGHLASGLIGPGPAGRPGNDRRLLRATLGAAGDLAGRRVLVTAGGTQEADRPGALHQQSLVGQDGLRARRGRARPRREVVLVTTPTALRVPGGVDCVRGQQRRTMLRRMTAALRLARCADHGRRGGRLPRRVARQRTRSSAARRRSTCDLVPNPDLLADDGRRCRTEPRPIRVGFAAETQDLLDARDATN